jgi:hypothetical protein
MKNLFHENKEVKKNKMLIKLNVAIIPLNVVKSSKILLVFIIDVFFM